MNLTYHDHDYYHTLYNKICAMPYGEVELNHKNAEEKAKFENHIKHWISTNNFIVFQFYIELNENYTKLLKKEYYT